jgi:hypothetical protein
MGMLGPLPRQTAPNSAKAQVGARQSGASLHNLEPRQASRIDAHEQRTVAQEADEVAVVPPALNRHVDEAEGDRSVSAWPHPQ